MTITNTTRLRKYVRTTVGGETLDSLYFLKRALEMIPPKKTVKKIIFPIVLSLQENLSLLMNTNMSKMKTIKLEKKDCLFKKRTSCLLFVLLYSIFYSPLVGMKKKIKRINDEKLTITYKRRGFLVMIDLKYLSE